MLAIDPARRTQILEAMGLQPQVLRAREAMPAVAACMLLAPAGRDAPEQALLGGILSAMGLSSASLRACEPGSRRGRGLGSAAYWIVFGAEAERALRSHQTGAGDAQAQIIVTHEPQRLLSEPLLKRELWQSIRALRKRLVAAEG